MCDLQEIPRVESLFFGFIFFLLKMYDSRTFRPWGQTWHVIPFRKAQRELSDEWGRKMEFFYCFFFYSKFWTKCTFLSLFVIFAILRGENYMFGHCFPIFCMYQNSYKEDRLFLHSWWDPRQMDHKVFKRNRYDYIACSNTCDHSSTNAPDPIRTPQLSVLGRE